jgi:NAD+ diphosphatase
MEHRPFYAVHPLFPVYPEPEDPSPARKRWILVQSGSVLFTSNPAPGTVLMPDPLPAGLACGAPVYLGTRGDTIYYAAEVPGGAAPPDGPKPRPPTPARARICTACSRIVYPRISPAIIVLIKKGEEVLLARSPRFPQGVFAVIAGFNEPGENLEQTVHREVREEVGIAVRNLRYFGSEPWPFPDSLMIGFVADHAGGEIRIDNQEIEAAGWFTRDTLPPVPSVESISRALIEAWIRREI